MLPLCAACAGPSEAIQRASAERDGALLVSRGNVAPLEEETDATARRVSESPQPSKAPDEALSDQCPVWDAALTRVAQNLAARAAAGKPNLDSASLLTELRAEGAPYVWPRAWTLSGPRAKAESVERLRAWFSSFREDGERRCGAASVGEGAVAVVAVDALADLEPVATLVRPGSWLDLRGHLLVPYRDAKWVALGPSGAPRTLPTAIRGANAEATLALDQDGSWILQLLADVRGGPRPVLELEVQAGSAAHAAPEPPIVKALADAAGQLTALLAAARAEQALPPLQRVAELDELAQVHANAMRAAHRIAHDLGDGDPETRVQAGGLVPVAVGENLAHAENAPKAHRALWMSPSHRRNMLDARFDSIGIGVSVDADGSVWACELFARFAR